MAKEKRKGRLDKLAGSTSNEFIGFGNFEHADTSTSSQQSPASGAFPIGLTEARWDLAYQGKNEKISALFLRIGQKRDSVTVSLSLQDLICLIENTSVSKRDLKEVLQHWAPIYYNKLHFSEISSIRALCAQIWILAFQRVPKIVIDVLLVQPEILGMLYSLQVDTAAEMQSMAESLRELYRKIIEQTNIRRNITKSCCPWQEGISIYLERMISYENAAAMREEIFRRKRGIQAELTYDEKATDEEQYERLISLALSTMERWIEMSYQDNVQFDSLLLMKKEDTLIWWKTLSSSKKSIRREAYSLLGTIALKAVHLLPEIDFIINRMKIVQVIASETDPSNISVLLKTILSLLVGCKQYANELQDRIQSTILKPLAKTLKNACYGSIVKDWGNILLPLIDVFSNNSINGAVVLLTSALDGSKLISRAVDQCNLLVAVTECSSFLLLRKTRTDLVSKEAAQQIIEVWLNAFKKSSSAILNGSSSAASIRLSTERNELIGQLTNDLVLFHKVSTSSNQCSFSLVSEWFWAEGLDFSLYNDESLSIFIHCLRKRTDNRCEHIVSAVCKQIYHLLSQYQGSSNAYPSTALYQLLLVGVDCFGPDQIFQACGASVTTTMERFVMNDLLRWIVIHTSDLTPFESYTMVEHDFCLLASILKAYPDNQKPMWETILRECIAAQCNLRSLTLGMRQLLQPLGRDCLSCATLDAYAKTIYEVSARNRTSVKCEEILNFCKLCVGLDSLFRTEILVSEEVIQEWIELTCIPVTVQDDNSKNGLNVGPLQETLFCIIQGLPTIFTNTQKECILMGIWYRDNAIFENSCLEFLETESELHRNLTFLASKRIRDDLQLMSLTSFESIDSLALKAWAMRAWRILTLSKKGAASTFSLESIGLGNSEGWGRFPKLYFELCLILFEKIDSKKERINLIQVDTDIGASDSILIDILLSLTDASVDVLVASRGRSRRDDCSSFLEAIGASNLEESDIEIVIRSIVTKYNVSKAINEPVALQHITCKFVSVVSQVLELIGTHTDPPPGRVLSTHEVVEGGEYSYITSTDRPMDKEIVTVAKVHRDDSSGTYFTIRPKQPCQWEERQTVIERLQKNQSVYTREYNISTIHQKMSSSKRNELVNLLFENFLSSPFFINSSAWPVGEIINVIANQLGIGSARGLVSTHYKINSLLMTMEASLKASLAETDLCATIYTLWSLSVALGYGLNSPQSLLTIELFRVQKTKIYEGILSYYDSSRLENNKDLDCAVLVWFSTSIVSLAEECEGQRLLLIRSLNLLYSLTSGIFCSEQNNSFSQLTLIACRAMHAGLHASTKFVDIVPPSDKEAFDDMTSAKSDAIYQLIRSFSSGWDISSNVQLNTTICRPEWVEFSVFPEIVKMSILDFKIKQELAFASRRNLDHLVVSLHNTWKQQHAYTLLVAVSSMMLPVQDNDVNAIQISKKTNERLRDWIKGVEEEEAAELASDVYTVAEWMPLLLMDEAESWIDDEQSDLDAASTSGRFLAWLVFLRFVDSAMPKDFKIRPAFVAYLSKCHAIRSILNLVIENFEGVTQQRRPPTLGPIETEDIFPQGTRLDLSKLALVVLFRTIEVFPSLSRRWWEEDCPKLYSSNVKAFVEKCVSPELLKRELDRIKTTATFGPMNVTASLFSREVTASYVQDDFTLYVLISMPPAFPLRSAEVDCSKTLGVPPRRWKRWSLQITMMLNNQGGTLSDAMMLWKENVDKEFDGVEPCPVCYSVLHVKTHKLPSLECKICHKRFHLECLTQWFRSSGKNQCVMCQQPWSGTRV